MRVTLLLVLGFFSFQAVAESPVISTQRLTMEYALQMAQGTIEACRKKGIQVGVTVVDRNGQPQVMLRDVLAPILTAEVSMKKAYTAAMFMANTSALESQANSSLAFMDNMMFSAGGIPIQAGGQMYGGIGVSGAPGGDIDEACAKEGIQSVIDDLEMM